jgi:hypothetical protein
MLLARQQTAQSRSLWASRVSMRGLRWCPWRLSGHTPVPEVSSLSSLWSAGARGLATARAVVEPRATAQSRRWLLSRLRVP